MEDTTKPGAYFLSSILESDRYGFRFPFHVGIDIVFGELYKFLEQIGFWIKASLCENRVRRARMGHI